MPRFKPITKLIPRLLAIPRPMPILMSQPIFRITRILSMPIIPRIPRYTIPRLISIPISELIPRILIP